MNLSCEKKDFCTFELEIFASYSQCHTTSAKQMNLGEGSLRIRPWLYRRGCITQEKRHYRGDQRIDQIARVTATTNQPMYQDSRRVSRFKTQDTKNRRQDQPIIYSTIYSVLHTSYASIKNCDPFARTFRVPGNQLAGTSPAYARSLPFFFVFLWFQPPLFALPTQVLIRHTHTHVNEYAAASSKRRAMVSCSRASFWSRQLVYFARRRWKKQCSSLSARVIPDTASAVADNSSSKR